MTEFETNVQKLSKILSEIYPIEIIRTECYHVIKDHKDNISGGGFAIEFKINSDDFSFILKGISMSIKEKSAFIELSVFMKNELTFILSGIDRIGEEYCVYAGEIEQICENLKSNTDKPRKLDFIVYEEIGDTAGDEFKKYNPESFPQDCYTSHRAEYHCNTDYGGYMRIPILEKYWGRKFDAAFYYLLSAFKPKSIRVTGGEVTCDSSPGRVTVVIDEDHNVKEVTQEVNVNLPVGIQHGAAMKEILNGRTPYNSSGVWVNTEALKHVEF